MYWQIKEDNLDKDCLPEPPTPTSIECPDGWVIIRVILHTCFTASSNRTKSIRVFWSLYSLNAWFALSFTSLNLLAIS